MSNMQSKIPTNRLKSLATKIFSGVPLYSVSRLNKSENGIPVVNIKDIVDSQILINNLPLFSLENFKNAERYLVSAGDVLLTCRGTQLKVVVVPDAFKKLLITAHLIAVRLNNELLSGFLAAYLRTENGQKALLANAASSGAQLMINISDVGEINVPVPPLSLQEKIVSLTNAAEEYYRISIETAELRRTIANQIIIEMNNHYRE